jgi:hypothetical protein
MTWPGIIRSALSQSAQLGLFRRDLLGASDSMEKCGDLQLVRVRRE